MYFICILFAYCNVQLITVILDQLGIATSWCIVLNHTVLRHVQTSSDTNTILRSAE